MTRPPERLDLALLARHLAAHGLLLRGGFNFGPEEAAPAKAMLLIGTAGAAYWPHFQAWLAGEPRRPADPLDTWSRTVIGEAAQRSRARAVSPSDRPFLPFQQWAMRAEGLKPSPLGILMHPRFGLWHAYRGALLFDRELSFEDMREPPHLCETCVERPCLRACPVDAYSHAGFAYGDCLRHVGGASGAPCRETGCLDRNACPHGTAFRYPAPVQAFHMQAFARV